MVLNGKYDEEEGLFRVAVLASLFVTFRALGSFRLQKCSPRNFYYKNIC